MARSTARSFRLEPVAIGATWLSLIAMNVGFVPSNERLFETYSRIGLTGQLVAAGVVGGYLVLSCLAITLVSLARERTRSQAIRDELFAFAGIGAASVVPWSLIALMRGDGPGGAPFFGPLWVLVPSAAAVLAALVLVIVDRSRTVTNLMAAIGSAARPTAGR